MPFGGVLCWVSEWSAERSELSLFDRFRNNIRLVYCRDLPSALVDPPDCLLARFDGGHKKQIRHHPGSQGPGVRWNVAQRIAARVHHFRRNV